MRGPASISRSAAAWPAAANAIQSQKRVMESILHHVAGECIAVFPPALAIKLAALITFRGSVPHPQGVVSIVMREKALPAERQYTRQAFQIGVDGMKMFKEIARV